MFPKPHTVEHSIAIADGENALGQTVITRTTRERAVMGWHTKSTHDGGSAVLDGRVTTDVTLLTDEPDWADGDIVTIPEPFPDHGDYSVHGSAKSCNTGPFGFTPGYTVTLRRVNHGTT